MAVSNANYDLSFPSTSNHEEVDKKILLQRKDAASSMVSEYINPGSNYRFGYKFNRPVFKVNYWKAQEIKSISTLGSNVKN